MGKWGLGEALKALLENPLPGDIARCAGLVIGSSASCRVPRYSLAVASS